MPKLIITDGGRRTEKNLGDDPIVVGRDASCDIVITDTMSSRRHCRLVVRQDVALVEDLESSNGTLLNGRRVQRAALTHGDVVKVGDVEISVFDTSSETKPAMLEEDLAPSPKPVPKSTTPAPASGDGILEAASPTGADSRRAAATGVSVEVVAGPSKGTSLDIDGSSFTIGRKPDNDLTLNDPRTSGLHARVVKSGDSWVLEDQGSGNGILVAGRRVKRIALANGLRCVLGESELMFRGAGLRDAPTAALPGGVVEGPEATHRVEVDMVPARSSQSQAFFTVIFMASFVVLLYGGYSIVNGLVAKNRLEPDPTNRLTHSSFEEVDPSGAVLGWAPVTSSTTVKTIEEGAPHGQRAVQVTGGGGEPAVLASNDKIKFDGGALRVGGDLRNEGFRAAGIRVDWTIDRGSESSVIATSCTTTSSQRPAFSRLEQVFVPPTWANPSHARVSVFGIGPGRLVADHFRVQTVTDEEELSKIEALPVVELESAVDEDRTLWFAWNADATLSVRRARETVVRRIGLGEDPTALGAGQVLATSLSRPQLEPSTRTTSASFRYQVGDRGTERSVFATGREIDDAFKLTYRVSGTDDEPILVRVDLDPRVLGLPVATYLDGVPRTDGGHVADLDGAVFDEWIVGEPANQVIISASQPVTARIDGPALTLVVEDRRSEFLDLYFSSVSKRERQLIASRRQQIAAAREEGRTGEVIRLWRELRDQLPWRSDLVAEAEREIRTGLDEGRTELQAIQLFLADYELFGHPGIGERVRARVAEVERAFEGTEIADEAESLRETARGEQSNEQGRQRARAARTAVSRAEQYFGDQHSELARYYAEYALSLESGDEDVERDARQILERYRIRKQ